MKKLLTLLILFAGYSTFAQTTNTFPAIGPVGIGTTTTSSSYPPGISNPGSGSYLEIKSLDLSYPSGIFLRRLDGVGNTGFDLTSDNNSGIIYADSRWDNEASSLRFRMNTLGTPLNVMTLSGNGNIGIGTNSPSTLLHIIKDVSPTLKIESSTNSNAYLVLKGGGTNSKPYEILSSGQGSYLSPGKLVISDGTSEVLTIKAGSVGINTIDPPAEYKFAVNGNMIAESVKVKLQSTWPDYVFQPTYKLPQLHETEKFIKANKHLPGIPSAKEVEKDGINLGEMNGKLLQKIEELTLYLIDMNVKLQSQQSEINQLKNSNRKLYNKR